MSERNEYLIEITINNKVINRIVIDQHYKLKHSDVTDEIIIELVKDISGQYFLIEEEKDGFQYFKVEPVYHQNKPYRLVLLLYIFDNFIGVINAFRVKEKKGNKHD